DVTPLRQLSAQSAQGDVILYQSQNAVRLHYPEEFDKRQPVGDNPPSGAIINYYFKAAPKDEVSLDILDPSGKVVRHLSSKEKKEGEQPPEWPDRVERVKTIPANAGMNRFAWDLRYEDPIQIPGAFYSSVGPRGPLAPPGDYQVKLRGSEGNLTFPGMVNERFETLSHTIEPDDTEPTQRQLNVFQMLSNQLEEQLKKWAKLKAEAVPKVSELIKQASLPALIISPPKKSE